ncbi:MAG: hypothetical protein ACOCUR_01635 [Nanoarchaeota archaeon]
MAFCEDNEEFRDECECNKFLKTDVRKVDIEDVIDDEFHFYTINLATYVTNNNGRIHRKVEETSFDIRGDEFAKYMLEGEDERRFIPQKKTLYKGRDALQVASITEYQRQPMDELELSQIVNRLYGGYRDNPFENSHQEEHDYEGKDR